MRAYKLFRKRKNGTLGPLFIDQRLVIQPDKWLTAKSIRTKRFAYRPGWHCCKKPIAPHLSKKNRVWCIVEVEGVVELPRPQSQGGTWLLAKKLKLIEELT